MGTPAVSLSFVSHLDAGAAADGEGGEGACDGVLTGGGHFVVKLLEGAGIQGGRRGTGFLPAGKAGYGWGEMRLPDLGPCLMSSRFAKQINAHPLPPHLPLRAMMTMSRLPMAVITAGADASGDDVAA